MEQTPYIFSVHELTRFLKTTLERERALQGVRVSGEVSNCKYHTSGHLYFSLKDDISSLPCVMWRERVLAQTFRAEDGMKITVEGNITVYERGGYYQLSAFLLQADGLGNLFLAFEQLKRKLEAEGLFAQQRKRPLPATPRRIALVTSPTGAVVHDFITVSGRRWKGRQVVLVPTAVQGAGAVPGIIHSLALAADIPDVDVIVLARGGGSFEDLACFNDERVARAIAASPLPVVSAIGHETDFTIADFVADLRAATPSAAAELVVPDRQGVDLFLRNMEQRIFSRMSGRLTTDKQRLERAAGHPAFRNPRALLQDRRQAVDLAGERILDRLRARLTAAATRLEKSEGKIAALNPRRVLQRGYALVTQATTDHLLTTAAEARQARALDIQFHDGNVQAQVTEE